MIWHAKKDIDTLSIFLAMAGESLKYFTFYEKRGVNYIERLDSVLWGTLDGVLVSYGHLDYVANDRTSKWIGLCVREVFTGKGYGRLTLERLEYHAVSTGNKKLKLSVHKSNTRAKSLYDSRNYTVVGESAWSYFMEKEI